jgi:BirA family transcriptional regulator, biotin operon repressor / biotin---[acetyl-CoA-carboxylase] ligase
MITIDTDALVRRLKVVESVAVIPRVSSTNLIARRVVTECIESELSLPSAIIIAGEQLAGKGRGARTWSSPPGKGIYATTMHTRPLADLSLVPLNVAIGVASFLRARFGIDARIKWPNDVLVGGRKIAGILIEARTQEDRTFLIVGTGINVEPLDDGRNPNATSIAENVNEPVDLAATTVAFIEYIDDRLSRPLIAADVLARWTELAVHREGEPIRCLVGDRVVSGTWGGIDELGRAILRNGEEATKISAGDLIMGSSPD